MRKRINRKGFTMAEVLIVVAIIVVLMGVGFIALMSHMRNMQKLEMDGQAKEIFVAAQNHLSLAKSQDYLGVAEYKKVGETTTMTGDFGIAEDAEKHIYYIVVNNASAEDGKGDPLLAQMLPFASVNEAARTGGSYIIRYQKDPAQILDVFYVSTTGRYGLASGLSAENDYTEAKLKGYIEGTSDVNLKEYGETKAVVGYYGGGTAGVPVGEKLKTPGVEIENGDRLLVKVTDYNSTSNEGTNELLLMIKSGDSIVNIPLVGTNAMDNARVTKTPGTDYITYTVVLDDVTTLNSGSGEADMHFFKLGGIAAGSNIQVVARAYNNKYVADIAESPAQETNSLFASKNGSTVEIASIRHLLNLDSMISGLSESVTSAVQISDLDWIAFMKNTRDKETEDENYKTQIFTVVETEASPIRYSAAGSYMPVNAPSGLDYQGQAGTNHITGITVTGGTGDAGLFASLSGGSVTNLELVDFKISASGNVGALVGTATNTTITGVLVHNSKTGGTQISDKYSSSGADIDYKIESSGSGKAAGGLIGEASGTVVSTSAAAVYVKASGDAGGLVGYASGSLTVDSSYSGGHTENAKYAALSPAGVTTVVNVQSTAGNAGGLVGHAGADLTVTCSYSTASASSGGSGVGVGGLVGKTDGAAQISNCYAVGLVTAPAGSSAQISPFAVGAFSGTNNYYLTSVSPMANVTPDSAKVTAVSSGDTSSELILPEASRKKAIPYDSTLTLNYKGQFFFPTVDQLHPNGWTGGKSGITDVHYGDWQIPQNTPLNYLLINGNTLDLIVELKDSTKELTFAVTGASSGNTRIFNLKLEKGDSAWTVTSATETAVVGDTVQPNSKDVSSYFTGASARFGAFQFSDTTYPALATSYAPGFTGKRTYSNGETFYDVKLTLDDITKSDGHFAQLLADTFAFGQTEGASPASISAQLIPGENITVRVASGNAAWSELKEIKDINDSSMESQKEQHEKDVDDYQIPKDYHCGTSIDNSLFATSSNSNIAVMSSASIVNVRHLQNLDTATSGVNEDSLAAEHRVNTATLANDLDWETEGFATIYNKSSARHTITPTTTSDKKTFVGIYNKYLTSFNGNNKTIKNLYVDSAKIEAGYGTEIANAGLFSRVAIGMTVSNLHLEDPVISGSNYAGAVIAHIDNSYSSIPTITLNTVLVEGENASITGASAAGGLIGYSVENLTITNSAAAALVKSTSGAAGGLVGAMQCYTSGGTTYTGVEMKLAQSYVGGHTYGGKYYVGDTDDAGASGRWNIISTAGAAGGLVGEFMTGTSLTVNNCFNTATVYSGAGNAAGGIVGNAAGTFVTDGSMYVIAPVYDVGTKTYVPATATTSDYFTDTTSVKGAIVGLGGTISPSAHSVFYLADIYTNPEVQYNQAVTDSNIKYIGTGTMNNVEMASYFAGEGSPILGVNTGAANLEYATTTYDSELGDIEYPFSIWTNFNFDGKGSHQHFYGDWEPVKNEPSVQFTFYFLVEDPTTGAATAPIVDFERTEDRSSQVGIQTIPYEEYELSIPAVPYIPGYTIGNGLSGDEKIVWTVYCGDLRDDLKSGGENSITEEYITTTTYDQESGTVTLQEKDVVKAKNNSGDPTKAYMTFVAHYVVDDSRYMVKLMDKDPSVADAEYERYGSLMMMRKDKKLTEEIADGNVILPRRNRPGYNFLGWYDSETGGTQIAALENGNIVVKSDKSNQDLILYARYEEIEYGHIYVDFLLESNGVTYSMDSTYKIQFDKSKGFHADIPLPSGSNLKGISITDADGNTVQPSEAKFMPEGDSVDEHTAVHFDTNVDGKHYTVKLSGEADVEERAYVIRYQMKQTSAVTPGSTDDYSNLTANTYTYSATASTFPVFNPYTGDQEKTMNLRTPQDIVPDVTGQPIPGFVVDDVEDFDYNSNNAATYQATGYTDGKLTQTYEAEDDDGNAVTVTVTVPIQYIMVVTYEREEYELSYESNGGTYIPPVKVAYGAPIVSTVAAHTGTNGSPTRTNYEFKGWEVNGLALVDENGTHVKENGVPLIADAMPAGPLQVDAVWEAGVVKYLVVYWAENANDDGYSFLKMETKQVQAGTTINGSTLYGNKDNAFSNTALNSEKAHFSFKSADTKEIQPGASPTVINVYFSRDLMTINFYRKGKWDERTTQTTDLYGEVGDDHVPLTPVSSTSGWSAESYSPENGNDGTQYGLIDGEYRQLTRQQLYSWKPRYSYQRWNNGNGNGYTYVIENQRYVNRSFVTSGNGQNRRTYVSTDDSHDTTPTQYYQDNNQMRPLSWYSSDWFGSYWYHTWRDFAWTPDRYNGTRYKEFTGARYKQNSYTGGNLADNVQRYRLVNGVMTPVDPDDVDGTQYYEDENHAFVELTRTGTGEYVWYYSGEKYEGQRYKKENGFPASYDGKRYKIENGRYVETEEDQNNVQYYGVDARGGHVKLQKGTVTTYTYDDGSGTPVVYTGRVVVWTPGSSWNSWRSWTGKYKADFRTYGKSWNDVKAYQWRENYSSGTYQTYLSAFTNTNSTYNLYDQNETIDTTKEYNRIYHYTQGTDGKYSNEKSYLNDGYGVEFIYAKASGSNGPGNNHSFNFNFSNKYEQFEVKKYGGSFNTTASRMSNTHDGDRDNDAPAALHIYHERKKYDITFYNGSIDDVTNSQNTIPDIYYDLSLSEVPTTVYNFKNPGDKTKDGVDYHFRGWYTDSALSKPFVEADSTTHQITALPGTMPGNDLPLFGKWTPDPSTVTFDGTYLNAETQKTFTVEYGETIGAAVAVGGKLTDAYTPKVDGYKFRYWYYTGNGTGNAVTGEFTEANHTPFMVSQEIQKDLKLYARMDPIVPEKAKVHIYYYLAGENNSYNPDDPTLLHEEVIDADQIVGSTYTANALPVDQLNGEEGKTYYPVYASRTITVRRDDPDSGKNKIVFLYREPQTWSYTVNYYIHYSSMERYTWLPEDASYLTNGSADLLVYTKTETAENRFQIVGYEPPEGAGWLANYKLDHFQVGNNPNEYAQFVTIQPPDDDSTVVVNIYVVPDINAIYIDDRNEDYDGNTHAIPSVPYTAGSTGCPVYLPQSADIKNPGSMIDGAAATVDSITADVHYLYYDIESWDELDEDDVKNAKTYGVNAYITVTVHSGEDSKTYLIWQSQQDSGHPGLHLYVQKRIVILQSGSAEANYSPDTYLVNHTVTSYDSVPSGWNAKNIGFVDGEGVTYVFSANAFRRNPGTSKNVFTYEPIDGTDVNNYNFFLLYGTLTVN